MRNDTSSSYCRHSTSGIPEQSKTPIQAINMRYDVFSATEIRIRNWSDCNGWQKPFGFSKVSITRMRLASQICEPRGALYLFASAGAGIVQRCTPDTCCLGRALGKMRCLLGERTQRKRASERVVTTRINYDRPFGVCSPLLRARCSRLLNVPLDWFTAAVPANYLSPFRSFCVIAILRKYFPRLRSRKGGTL